MLESTQSKILFRTLFPITVTFGLILMLYSFGNPIPENTYIYNIQKISSQAPLYKARVTCDYRDHFKILRKCIQNAWIMPPVCPILEGPNANRIESWSPVIFKCSNLDFIQEHADDNFNYQKRLLCWNVGRFLFLTPFIVLCGIFTVIGVYQYYRRGRNYTYSI